MIRLDVLGLYRKLRITLGTLPIGTTEEGYVEAVITEKMPSLLMGEELYLSFDKTEDYASITKSVAKEMGLASDWVFGRHLSIYIPRE